MTIRFSMQGIRFEWDARQLLHVAFVERDEVFRIISARQASHMERRVYENQ